jgi:tetratricopeptide (TPR) repeat protein
MAAGLTVALLALGIAGRIWYARALPAAQRALHRHDLPAARTSLDRYLARWPRDEALLLAARVARLSDACADAEQLIAAFEEAFGPTDASRLEWALLGTQQGDYHAVEGRLRSFVASYHPDSSAILEALARGYLVAYQFPQALETLGRLIDRSPGHVRALLMRGTALERLRRMEAADEDCRRVAELAPQSAEVRRALGDLLNRLGHTEEAIAQYEVVLAARPAEPAALLGLARAFIDAADLDEAERRLDELLAADPDNTEALVERGRLALRRKRPAEAEPFLARAVRTAPHHREARQLHLVALKELGRSKAAAECEARLAELEREDAVGGRLKARVRDDPAGADARWQLWLWSQRNGQGEAGLPWLLAVLAVAPRHARAHAALADHFDRAGQPRRAALHRASAKIGRGSPDEARQ